MPQLCNSIIPTGTTMYMYAKKEHNNGKFWGALSDNVVMHSRAIVKRDVKLMELHRCTCACMCVRSEAEV